MSVTLYINKDSTSLANALIAGLANVTPLEAPELVLADKETYKIVIVDSAGAAIDYTATHTVQLAIGTPGATATGGTFTITSGHTTDPLAYNISAADLEAALNAISEISTDGSVDVTGTAPNWEIRWRTTGAKTAITATSSGLTPVSTVHLNVQTAGAEGVAQVLLMRILADPLIYQPTWADDAGTPKGYTATLNMVSLALAQAFGTATELASYIQVKQVLDDLSTTKTILFAPITLRRDI